MRHLLCISVVLVALTSDARAEWPRKYEPHLVLAITWVAEAGWDNDRDHIAMGHVLRRRANGKSSKAVASMARRYSQGTWNLNRTRSKWLRGMYADCRVPTDWPYSRARWRDNYQRKCKRVVAMAKRFLTSPMSFKDPCEGKPTHFGGPMDLPSSKLERVECENGMKQLYYKRKGKNGEPNR